MVFPRRYSPVFLGVTLCTVLAPSAGAQFAANSNSAADNQRQAQARSQIEQVNTLTSKLPRIDVTHSDFAAGCPNPADPRGIADSTCAIRNAIRFAQSARIEGAGYPVVYFPHGRYSVAGTGLSPALEITRGISLVGDGAQSSVLFNASPSAGLVAYNSAEGDCSGKPGPCFILIEGLTFAGAGHTTMGGLVEINSTHTGLMEDVVLTDTGGIALNLQGSSERWIFSHVEINQARRAVLTEGDTNENYFDRVNVISPGQDQGHFCFSVNCPRGQMAATNLWLPDPHAAVFLDGDNVHWTNSSIKSTAWLGGIRMATITSSVSHTYFEGFPFGGQQRNNFAIEVGGKMELGHLTQRIGPGDLTIPVDDAGWQPLYVNDPAVATINGTHAYTNVYAIYPADYVWQSKEPSSAVAGITRGTAERIRVASFAGDGRAHLRSRAQDGTTAIAWPAGSIIEQEPPNGYGSAHIEENHLDSTNYLPDARIPSGCDDTEQLKQWTSNPSRLCAEIIAGLVPDGYAIPFPSQHFIVRPFALDIVDNSIGTAGDERAGKGWIKVAGNASLLINQGNAPLNRFTSADTALNTYLNGNTRVQIVKWGDSSALSFVHDVSANVIFAPQDHYYSSDIAIGAVLSHQYLNEECWYPLQPGDQQPTSRFCVRASGPAQEHLVNGHWLPAGK